ncbi:MAG: hypothetical protein ACRC6N_00030 [Plesiomonas sp.]|uniref:hypothetical protein n=1 Tax=Plesiomonas sp. TaxID=2486279 RepID=UPI003F36A5E3
MVVVPGFLLAVIVFATVVSVVAEYVIGVVVELVAVGEISVVVGVIVKVEDVGVVP